MSEKTLVHIRQITKICEANNIQTPGDVHKVPIRGELSVASQMIYSQVQNRLENTCFLCGSSLANQINLINHFSQVHFDGNIDLIQHSTTAAYISKQIVNKNLKNKIFNQKESTPKQHSSFDRILGKLF